MALCVLVLPSLGPMRGWKTLRVYTDLLFFSMGMFGPLNSKQCPEKPVVEDIVKDLEKYETNEYVTKYPKEYGKDEDPNQGSVETEMDKDKSSGSNITHNLYGFVVDVILLAVVISL